MAPTGEPLTALISINRHCFCFLTNNFAQGFLAFHIGLPVVVVFQGECPLEVAEALGVLGVGSEEVAEGEVAFKLWASLGTDVEVVRRQVLLQNANMH